MLPTEVHHYHHASPQAPTVDIKLTQAAKGELRYEIEVNDASSPEQAVALAIEAGEKLDAALIEFKAKAATEA